MRKKIFFIFWFSFLTFLSADAQFFKKVVGFVDRVLNSEDTAYIEPQHYKIQAMMQNIASYDVYSVTDKQGNSVTFSPDMSLKVGPYIGWQILFVGYSIDVLHLGKESTKRKEFDLSLYTLPFGIDFFWRNSGDDYHISNISVKDVPAVSQLKNEKFSGFQSSIKGFDAYYIFNNKHYSYPAAFNQSTQQKRSAGSALVGLGYTRHTLDIDWTALNKMSIDKTGQDLAPVFADTEMSEKVIYSDFSLSGGYGYNWVFAKNWLLAASASLALSYKYTSDDTKLKSSMHGSDYDDEYERFQMKNFGLDGVGRFGLVWNNSKYFAGLRAILYSFNYYRDEFYSNNFFGTINLYFGFNFAVKKKYRKPKF